MRALNQSVNLSNPLELRNGDVLGKMAVEDANVRVATSRNALDFQ